MLKPNNHLEVRCHKCSMPIVPDYDSRDLEIGEWDQHTYKFSCNCNGKDLRISIC